MREKASILVGLLWCLALLSIAVFGLLHTSRMDLMVVKNYGDRIQAYYLALAGVERAKALLFKDSVTRRETAKNHTGALYDDETDFRDIQLGRGEFRVFHGSPVTYGITDEESRFNVNTTPREVLSKIKGMSAEIVSAIVDWRTATNAVSAGGAGLDYYSSLTPPYLPRNGPLQTVRELLMVRGVTPELLLGDTPPPGEADDPTDEPPAEDGWLPLMTVDSADDNVNAAGKTRVDLQTADEAALTAVQGITPAIARDIVQSRGQKPFQSIADLLDLTAQPTNQRNGPPQAAAGNGSPVIDDQLFEQIADDLTVGDNTSIAGLVNINTAAPEVLECLPGIDTALSHAILSYRQSDGFFPNVAALLKVSGMTHDIFKQIAPMLTTRSETFRVISEGRITSTGVRQRIQAILHVGPEEIQTLSYEENL
ncbi:MAG TPA: helix-hairpin-helix domain-containing protein [Verrucomicrobiae bacterium]|nr:helix-hairpin-helix domain-containing protein [Verrucomicrobiae bacterium]